MKFHFKTQGRHSSTLLGCASLSEAASCRPALEVGGTQCAGAITETSSVGTAKAEKPAAKAKAEKPAPKAVTIDDLRAAATKCVEAGKKAKLVEINTGFGVAGISKLAPEQYADALKAYEALAAEPEDDPTA